MYAFDIVTCAICVPELLEVESVTLAKGINVEKNEITVDRVIPGGSEVVKSTTPVLITVSNEYGEPRYPNLRGIMAAGKIQPTIFTLSDLDLRPEDLKNNNEIVDIFIPEKNSNCEFIEGEDEYDIGRNLAITLRDKNLI